MVMQRYLLVIVFPASHKVEKSGLSEFVWWIIVGVCNVKVNSIRNAPYNLKSWKKTEITIGLGHYGIGQEMEIYQV